MRDRVLYAVIITSIVISVAAILAPIAAKPRGSDPPEIPLGTILTINCPTGEAYVMPPTYYYKGVSWDATLYLECTVIKTTPGVVTFSVDSGTLTVDTIEVYSVDNGKGNWRSNSKLEIIATVTLWIDGEETFQLILHGADGPPALGTFGVEFFMPQSKLAKKYLLELTGEIVAVAPP